MNPIVQGMLSSLVMATIFVSTAKAEPRLAMNDAAPSQFVEISFRSLCRRSPDPSSLNYYLNQLAEGASNSDVRSQIQTTCLRQADACRHVSGLDDVCPPPEN